MAGGRRHATLLWFLLALVVIAAIVPLVVHNGVWAQEQVPGGALGSTSDSDFWRAVRRGEPGTVSIPDQRAAIMIQSEGELWRAIRNGPLSLYGAWLLGGIIVLLALFFIIRGRIRIDAGPSGRRITRFNAIERFTHWLTASCFVVLALTGLNMLYGRYVLKPLIGADLFALLMLGGKYAHNYLAFGFMVGLVLMFVIWAWANIPNHYDIIWLLKGGGIFKKGVHPPAKKFNAGQKILFWLVILLGGSLSFSGIMLLFPFQLEAFGPTFAFINGVLGTELPTELTPIQETQLAQLWHAIAALILMAVILGHIYIGSIGMEGAFDAVGTGDVDLNWAREHHNLWVEELERKGRLAEAGGDD